MLFPDFFVYAGKDPFFSIVFFNVSTNFPDFYVVFVISLKILEKSALAKKPFKIFVKHSVHCIQIQMHVINYANKIGAWIIGFRSIGCPKYNWHILWSKHEAVALTFAVGA